MTEFWVMRVVQRAQGGLGIDGLTDDVAIALLLGRYQLINDDVCEPIECYEDADVERAQRLASERATAEHARTGCVHKVVANIDLPG